MTRSIVSGQVSQIPGILSTVSLPGFSRRDTGKKVILPVEFVYLIKSRVYVEIQKVIGILVGTLGILGSLAGAASWVDGRYDTRTHVSQMRQEDEQARIQSDIDLYQLKLNFLETKNAQTQEDKNEIAYLEHLITALRDRQKQISK